MIDYYKNIFFLNKKNKLLINLLNILLYTLPLSFILGNLIINLNIFLFILIGCIHYKQKIINIKDDLLTKLLLVFFLYIIFSTLFSFFEIYFSESKNIKDFNNQVTNLMKSVAFLRFFIFLLIIKKMLNDKKLLLKPFFFISLFLCLFVSIDLIFQEIFGFNFFGMEPVNIHKRSGIFGEELIAGSYIFRFGIIGIFSYFIFFKKNNLYKLDFKNIILMSLIFIGLILTTNRIPLISFLFLFFLSIFIFKNNRKFFIKLFLLFFSIFLIFFFSHHRTNHNYKNLILKTFAFIEYNSLDLSKVKKNISGDEDLSSIKLEKKNKSKKGWHINIYYTSYMIWKTHPIIGGGLKSFRHDCFKISPNVSYANKISCGNHSHNYYLEILTELGVVGLLVFISFLFILLKNFNYRKKNNNQIYNISYLFFLILIVELFPIKSTGSFFTTGNAAYIFLIIGILMSNKLQNKGQSY